MSCSYPPLCPVCPSPSSSSCQQAVCPVQSHRLLSPSLTSHPCPASQLSPRRAPSMIFLGSGHISVITLVTHVVLWRRGLFLPLLSPAPAQHLASAGTLTHRTFHGRHATSEGAGKVLINNVNSDSSYIRSSTYILIVISVKS